MRLAQGKLQIDLALNRTPGSSRAHAAGHWTGAGAGETPNRSGPLE